MVLSSKTGFYTPNAHASDMELRTGVMELQVPQVGAYKLGSVLTTRTPW